MGRTVSGSGYGPFRFHQYHSVLKEGTEKTPQWTKIPNLASARDLRAMKGEEWQCRWAVNSEEKHPNLLGLG